MTNRPEPFFIRTARRMDLDAIRSLLVEAWHDTYDLLIGAEKVTEITDSWHSIPALAARLEQPRSEFIVADSGRQIGGMAFSEADEGGDTVFLRQLYVLPALQRRRIGSALLNELDACYPDAKRMCVEVEKANERAIQFYALHGFQECGRLTDDFGLEIKAFERAIIG